MTTLYPTYKHRFQLCLYTYSANTVICKGLEVNYIFHDLFLWHGLNFSILTGGKSLSFGKICQKSFQKIQYQIFWGGNYHLRISPLFYGAIIWAYRCHYQLRYFKQKIDFFIIYIIFKNSFNVNSYPKMNICSERISVSRIIYGTLQKQ